MLQIFGKDGQDLTLFYIHVLESQRWANITTVGGLHLHYSEKSYFAGGQGLSGL